MASSINALTTGSGGVVTTADNSGILNLQTGGTTAVTVNASQNVGIGTTSPTEKVTVTGNMSSTANGTFYIDGTNAGTVANPTYSWVVDTDTGMYRIQANTIGFATAATERMRIDASGNLLVGRTSQVSTEKLSVENSGDTYVAFFKGGSAGQYSQGIWNPATSGNNLFTVFATEGSLTTRGSISYNRAGGLTAYNTTSDYRAKTVNGAVENALGKLALLKPCAGRMNGATEDIDFFVAHELQEVVPSAVTGEKDAVKEDGTPDYQMVDKSAIIPLLTAAIQELKAIVDTQAEQIKALQGAK